MMARSSTRSSSHPIAIDYTAAFHQRAGIGRYVRELVAALTKDLSPIKGDSRLKLFVAGAPARLPPPPSGCQFSPSALSERWHARLWHRLRLPIPVELWTGRIELYHATDFTLPPMLPGARAVLTIHDLAFERFPDETMPGMLSFLRAAVPQSIRRADHIIAVSESTKRDLVELYGTPEDKISVIPHGVSAAFSPIPGEQSAIRQKYRLPDAPFILTVGTLQPRKNHLRLVQAFARMPRSDLRLVIAGAAGWGYAPIQAEVARLGLENRVCFTGFIAEADLPALYRAARLFAYPALYEGFGLPVLEAMACGIPVLTANVSSLPEVAGDAALLVDPLDVEAIAGGLSRLLEDDNLSSSLRRKGIERAARFTWAKAAEQTWGVYRRLLG